MRPSRSSRASSRRPSAGIIGGGAAGLSLGLLLGERALVFEREPLAGGLCRSLTVDGFTFDQGPHVLGGIEAAVSWVLRSVQLEGGWVQGQPRNRAWLDGQLRPHPFEDARDVERYTAKLWKTDPAQLSQDGLQAQFRRRPGGASHWHYPRRGGYGAITEAWAAALGPRLVTGWPQGAAGLLGAVERVVDTSPVTMDGAGFLDLVTVTAGYEGEAPDLTAVYIAGPESPFHRVSYPASFSPENAPAGCYSVQAERTRPAGLESGRSWRDDIQAALGLFADLGHGGAPVMTWAQVSAHAYPVPTPLSERRLRLFPAPATVIRHGRSGAHRYLNLDGVVAASRLLAERLEV